MNVNCVYLLKLYTSAIKESAPPEIGDDADFALLFRLAKAHEIAGTVYYALEKLNIIDDSALDKKWRDKRSQLFHRALIQKQELLRAGVLFDENGIDYMPVKGFFVSSFYPQEDFRTMSDIDVLVSRDNLKKAGELLTQLGYKAKLEGIIHHDVYNKPPFLSIELHHELVGINSEFYDYYSDLTGRYYPEDGHRHRLRDEDAYIFCMVHAYKHFAKCGFGIRTVSDFYFLNKKLLPKLDAEYINNELKKLKISSFVREISDIAEKWFDRQDFDSFSKTEKYILESGVYGTKAHKIENISKEIGYSGFILKRVFPPLREMQAFFPRLRKYPILLPFYYVFRIFRQLSSKRRGNTRKELHTLHKIKEKNKD